MKKFAQSFIALLIISFLVSCNGNPFMKNLFSGIDVYELPDSFGSADDILDEAGDDGFLDALAENDELADQVIDILDDVLLEDPATATTEDQEAALLLADVHLATTEADDTVDNVNQLLLDFIAPPEGEESPSFDSPESVVTELFVVDETLPVAEQEAAVAEQLEAFLAAADALEFYGDTIIGGNDPSSEVIPGETASTAMIAGMTSYMIGNMDISTIDAEIIAANPGATDEELAIAALTDVIVNGGTMPEMEADPAVDDAPTTEAMLEAMLGPGLAEVVDQGFDLSSLDGIM